MTRSKAAACSCCTLSRDALQRQVKDLQQLRLGQDYSMNYQFHFSLGHNRPEFFSFLSAGKK